MNKFLFEIYDFVQDKLIALSNNNNEPNIKVLCLISDNNPTKKMRRKKSGHRNLESSKILSIGNKTVTINS